MVAVAAAVVTKQRFHCLNEGSLHDCGGFFRLASKQDRTGPGGRIDAKHPWQYGVNIRDGNDQIEFRLEKAKVYSDEFRRRALSNGEFLDFDRCDFQIVSLLDVVARCSAKWARDRLNAFSRYRPIAF